VAARGHLGGLSWSTPQAMRVLDAAGFDVVIVETVGVGQSEVEVAGLADTTVVLLAPGMGDGIQAAKAGILEIGDVYVVNKADRDGAPQVARELRAMLNFAERTEGEWRQPILKTVAQTGEGVGEVVIGSRRALGVAGVPRRPRRPPGAPGPGRDRGDRGRLPPPPLGTAGGARPARRPCLSGDRRTKRSVCRRRPAAWQHRRLIGAATTPAPLRRLSRPS